MTQMSHTEPVHAISVYFRRTPDTVNAELYAMM